MPTSLLGWIQDWRSRRSAFSEMRRMQARDRHTLAPVIEDKLKETIVALDRRDFSFAAELWAAALAIDSAMTKSSKYASRILVELGRIDEAESIVREGMRRDPKNIVYYEGYALAAEHRPDLPEAIERWAATRKRFPRGPNAYWRASACLVRTGRAGDAEKLMNVAVKLLPADILIRFEHARAAEAQQDWPAALTRWETVRDRFRHHIGISGAARALAKLGRSEEADAMLVGAGMLFPTEPVLFLEAARVAEVRGDLPEAIRRWAEVRRRFPKLGDGYSEGMRILTLANDRSGIDSLIQQAREERPDLALAAPAALR